jgi:hypothetical protein
LDGLEIHNRWDAHGFLCAVDGGEAEQPHVTSAAVEIRKSELALSHSRANAAETGSPDAIL